MVFESLFHCVYPVATYPVEFRNHPTIPELEASYCGVVRCKVDDAPVSNYTKKSTAHIVFECWTGEELKPYTNMRFKNLNIYDTSFENLEILDLHCVVRIAKEKEFTVNTVNQMLLREKLFGHKRDMEQYFKELGIPQRYIKAWQNARVKDKVKQTETNFI